MKKKIIKLVIIMIYFSFFLYLIYYSFDSNNIKTDYYINSKSNYYYKKMIEIPKINLKLYIEKADEDFSNLNNNLVYYNDFDPDNKIIIFGHSGLGTGTFFNRLDELKKEDKLSLYEENKVYIYQVNRTYTVDKKRVDILKNEEKSKKLLLVTCHKINKNNRLVVELLQNTVKTIEK